MKELKVGIIGAGSLGSLFGGLMSRIPSEKYHVKVTLFGREDHVNAIKENGLIIVKDQEKWACSHVEAFQSPEDFRLSGANNSVITFDYLFLTTKAHSIESAMNQYQELISSCRSFVILQNGIGNEERAKRYCPKEKIIRVLTSAGAFKIKPGEVIYTGEGITKMGFPFKEAFGKGDECLNTLQELFHLASLETLVVKDINEDCWEKVFVNIGINAIGALTRLKNGELLNNKAIKEMMRECVEEAVFIAQKMDAIHESKDFVEIMFDVARRTSENANSMLQDVLNEKRTEIDYINGRIVELASELNVKVPVNALITALIKGLEQSLLSGT